jgi:hypothetical protein
VSAPLRTVLDAFTGGARSRVDVARRTGLSPDLVDAAIEHLIRLGRLEAKELAIGCPSGGCSTCASGIGDAPGCGAPTPGIGRGGRALVQLSVRPHPTAASGARPC